MDKKYEICIGMLPKFQERIFGIKEWIYFITDNKIKKMIENYEKEGDSSIGISVKNIEYAGNFGKIFKKFSRKPNKLEIKLKNITDVLYVKEIN